MRNSDPSATRGAKVWWPLLLAFTLVLGLWIGLRLGGQPTLIGQQAMGGNQALGGNNRIEELLRYIDARYVEDADQEALTRTAIQAVLDELDPHSSYIPVEEMQALLEQMEGNFDGIGIEFMLVADTIVVVSALSGGPSEQAGVLAGDKIILIGDSLVAGETASDIDPTKLLKGLAGTTVEIQVKRAGVQNLLPFTITRAPIPVHSVDVAYKLDEQTAYIKINRFSATTYTEFSEALQRLVSEQDAGNLIIDLRQNPGGYLEQAIKLLSQLFPDRGQLLVYTEGANVKRRDYTSNGRAFYRIDKIAILIDEGSASASEIVAGAIQDHDRGIIVGRRSFGKGLVQEQYDLSDGSALRLTVSRYFTPSGRSIQRSYEQGEAAYREDWASRYHNGEINGTSSIELDSNQLFYTDKGHTVFGGGGIMPDRLVPIDSLFFEETYLRLRQEIAPYIYTYLDQHKLVAPANLEQFLTEIRIDRKAVLTELRAKATQAAGRELPNLRPIQEDELLLFFKARLARHFFGIEAFYRMMAEGDEVLQQTQKLLRAADPLAAARER